MIQQTKPQLKLMVNKKLDPGEFEMNGVKLTYQDNSFLDKDSIYEFSDGFIIFLTNPIVTYDDKIEEDENKIKSFLFDIGYDIGKGDKRSSRYRTIKRILEDKEKQYGRGLTKDKLIDHSHDSANSLVERLELLILETKAGHDVLYDEKLIISKQQLSVNIIN